MVWQQKAEAAMRYQIDRDPFLAPGDGRTWRERGLWPARWVGGPLLEAPFVAAFRLCFTLAQAERVHIHVSADERYELFLDGLRIGRGPARGAPERWHYESYALDLEAGDHLLAARVWAMGARAALAQMSVRPGWLCAAEAPHQALISTGVAAWEYCVLPGYSLLSPGPAHWRGARTCVDGRSYTWDWERGAGTDWAPAESLGPAVARRMDWEFQPLQLLTPTPLPAQIDTPRGPGRVRHVAQAGPDDPAATRVSAADSLDEPGWQALADGRGPVTLAPHTARRVFFDLEDYCCAYPLLVTSGGAGAKLRLNWAESLRAAPEPWNHDKGQRDEVEGKFFVGFGDEWQLDGGAGREYEALWWQAGRYLELLVRVGDQPLTIERLTLHETRYPLENQAAFGASDARLAEIVPLMVRGMQMCAHETYMDCPYYEELQYAGDMRLELLTTYAMTSDARLAREALHMFDVSRLPSGLTQSRFPSRNPQIIAPFALWWALMVADYAFWRDDPATVAALTPGVRATLEAFERFRDAQGLLGAPEGWNYMDWVPAWSDDAGAPPGAAQEPSGLINWQLAYAQLQIAELEEALGEPELAARLRRKAAELAARLEPFWSAQRGLYADDRQHSSFSEHTQCLALLSGLLPARRRAQVATGLLSAPDLQRTTIYFSHYLFETLRMLGRIDVLLERMQLWFDLCERGLRTPVESPEPTRSDCHAWASHPLFHYQASILGVRPAGLGFRRVEIAPQLGPLSWASGSMPHPRGQIEVSTRVQDGRLQAEITLPEGLEGVLRWQGRHWPLHAGRQELVCAGAAGRAAEP
jgi:hypothetical protein